MINEINNDITYDTYGDISFFGNDINVLINEHDVIYQNIIFRLSTNFGDIQAFPEFGANLQFLIGRQNNSELETLAKQQIIKALTFDGFLKPQQIVVATLAESHTLYIRISVLNSGRGTISEFIRINSIFNSESGHLHVVT